MSEKKKETIILFNKKSSTKSIRISCELHIIQIILNNFEQEVFDIILNSTSFLRKSYIYNLFYLA